MAGVVAGSIAGWSPIGRRDEEGSASHQSFSQDHGRSSLEHQEGIEIHPDTHPDDPIIVRDLSSTLPPSQKPETTPGPQPDQ